MTLSERPAGARPAADPPVPFSIDVQPNRERVRVRPAGELDVATADRLREQLAELLEAGFEHVVIDLRELRFIDSCGLRLLLTAHADSRRDGWRLSLVHGPTAVRRLFELTHTLELLPFEPPT